MNRASLFVLLSVLFFPTPAHAKTYKPATVGYLYENCARALENSTTPKDFLGTYCGGFIEGYGMGVLVTSPPPLPAPDVQDPCRAEKQKEYTRINARLCKNLPDYTDAKTPPGLILQTAADIVARWRKYLETNKNLAVLDKPATSEINALITPGKFCNALGANGPDRNFSPLKINTGLMTANWYEFVQGDPVTLGDKVTQCESDLKKTPFTGTRCAAEITGFIAGIYSTHHLQKRKPANGACGKEVNRLYDSLDMAGRTCVTQTTDPAAVAKVFLQGSKNPQGSGFGGAGYHTIYYGFMCAKQ